jgi:drug/metabolite transporter (DMT)-like permease
LLSFIGVIVIVFQDGALSFSAPGLIAILVAAITESFIYITFKSRYSKNNYDGLFHLYAGGLIAVLLASATNIIDPFEFNPAVWRSLLFFVALIGFAAFAILTYSIPLMSSELYSSLAFFGVLSAYIFGHIGSENTPTIKTMIGSGLIVAGAVAVRYLSK